ncbi:MAG: hypothetical protein WDO16_08120 [Bacteroidota bacterium]
MRKQSLLISLSFLLTLSFLSCKKEDSINAGVFQGKMENKLWRHYLVFQGLAAKI